MAMEVTGKLRALFDTKQVSERFAKREFVLEIVDGKFPQTVLFQLTGDRCASLDEFAVGDEVRVEFNLRGREWRSPQGDVKYVNSLDVWRIESARGGANAGRGSSQRGGRRASNGDPRDLDVPPPAEPTRDPDAEDLPF